MEPNEIVTAASAVLAKSSVPELRNLRVDEESNELQLHGRVAELLSQATCPRGRVTTRG